MDIYALFGVLLLCSLNSISQVCGDAEVSVKFVSYASDGQLGNGHCCDNWPICSNDCDFKFEICLTIRGGGVESADCEQTRVVKKNRNSLDFRSSMGGVSNPIRRTVGVAPNSIDLVVNVVDHDRTSGDDEVDSLAIYIAPVHHNETTYTLSSRTTLEVLVEVKCSEGFVGDCSVFCPPAPHDNFVCDPSTGTITCAKGWRGEDCGEQYKIHENNWP